MSPLHAVFLLIDNCVAILPAEETVSLLLYLRKSSWSEQRKTFMMLLICLHHLNRNVITGFLRNAVCTWSNWHKATKHTTYSVQQIFRPKYWQTLFEVSPDTKTCFCSSGEQVIDCFCMLPLATITDELDRVYVVFWSTDAVYILFYKKIINQLNNLIGPEQWRESRDHQLEMFTSSYYSNITKADATHPHNQICLGVSRPDPLM